MYDTNSIVMLYPDGQKGALSNICHGNGSNRFATVTDLQDAVEDSSNAEQLVQNISRLNIIGIDTLKADRDTDTYTRLRGTDSLGNVYYLKILKVGSSDVKHS